jgi:hypothetical protein
MELILSHLCERDIFKHLIKSHIKSSRLKT